MAGRCWFPWLPTLSVGNEVHDNEVEDLVLQTAGSKGLGVFAARGFISGETILSFAGPLLRPQEIVDFTHTIQVDKDLFLGASGAEDDYVNHSCEPNSHVWSSPPRIALKAIRNIAPGEEITFDYSTCLLLEPPLPTCHCGATTCRGRVVAYWDLDPGRRRRLRRLGAVPEFVLRGRRGGSSRPERRGERGPGAAPAPQGRWCP